MCREGESAGARRTYFYSLDETACKRMPGDSLLNESGDNKIGGGADSEYEGRGRLVRDPDLRRSVTESPQREAREHGSDSYRDWEHVVS